jgi:hypothetical protein
MATRKWESLNPETLKYQMIFVKGDQPGYADFDTARKFIEA